MADRPALREVTQSFLAGREDGIPGDCVRAAVASLLDLDPADVPHFTSQDDPRVWRYALAGFAAEHGWRVAPRSLDDENDMPEFGLAIGPSPRGISHAVVVRDAKIVWDPHPSHEGLVDVQQVIAFEAINDTAAGTHGAGNEQVNAPTIRDFAWGQSIGLNTAAGVVDIPFNDGETWAGCVLVGMDDVRVLRDMLDGVLEKAGGGDD